MVRKNWTDLRTSATVALALVATIVLVVQAVSWRDSESQRIRAKSNSDLQKRIEKASVKVNGKLTDMYKSLRTLSRLPGVRSISSDGKSLDLVGRTTIQELYNDLADTLHVSEIYIVPKDIDPDSADESRREPITTFDELIVGKTAGKKESTEKVEEVEIYEYREMRRQAQVLASLYGDKTQQESLDIPFLSSPEVVTCDNTKFDPDHPNDRSRSGLVLSVPIFTPEGKFKGLMTSVILSSALADLLAEDGLALTNGGTGVKIASTPSDVSNLSSEADVPALSVAADLPFKDLSGKWRVSTAFDTHLDISSELTSLNSQFAMRAAIAAILGLCMIAAAIIESSWRKKQLQTKEDLHRQVAEQTEALSKMVGELESINEEYKAQADELEQSTGLLQERQNELHKALEDSELQTALYAHASKRFESLFNGLPVGCATIDANHDVMEWNATMGLLAKCPAHDVLLRPVKVVLSGIDGDLLSNALESVFQHGEAAKFESEWKRVEGPQMFVQISIFPLRHSNGETAGAIICAADITAATIAAREIATSEAKLRAFIDHAPVPFAIFDMEMRYQAVSRAWCQTHGLKQDDLIGKVYEDVFEESPELWKTAFGHALEGTQVSSAEDRFQLHDGTTQWTKWECCPWYQQEGVIGGVAVITENVTERHTVLEQLFDAHEQVSSILESINDSFMSIDNDDLIVYINHSACQALDMRKSVSINGSLKESCPPEVYDKIWPFCVQARQTGLRQDCDFEFAGAWLEFRVYPSGSGISIFFQDISERKRIERQVDKLLIEMNDANCALEVSQLELRSANANLQALATTDGLTGIHNHRYFQDFLAEHIESCRAEGTNLSVILMDVDKFKSFNDEFGHQAGDTVLIGVAKCLSEVVEAPHLVARYGGEEFVVVAVGLDQEQAWFLAEKIRKEIEGNEWTYRQVTASFGVSMLMDSDDKPQKVIERSDKALYTSKEQGRNRSTIFGEPQKQDGSKTAKSG